MANVSVYARKAMLDWVLGGATPTRPSAWWVGLSYGAPTSVSGSEIAFSRATLTAAAANTSNGILASNAASVAFASQIYASTVSGYQVWDASAGGNMLWFGLLSAATLPSSKSAFVCPVASALFSAL